MEEEVSKRKPFARRLYLRSYSQQQTIIMKFNFYKVQFFFSHGKVCFLRSGGNIPKEKYFGMGRLICHHYFDLMN